MEERRNNFGRIEGRARSKKLSARVDLTAMVSVSFLLIIFFMLTSYMSRPQAINIEGNDNVGCCDCLPYEGDNRSMTILVGGNNKLVSYLGNFALPLEEPKELKCGENGLRKELLRVINALPLKDKRGLSVYVKLSEKATYENLVDVLDEMAITKVSYAMVEISHEELQLLANK